MRKLLIVVAFLVAACHEDRPPAPTAKQSEQLNDADTMLNDLAKNDEGAKNEEGPEANASGPSDQSK